ncbi:MAG: hypothetical protein R3A44_40045 [Caldilineaceae bacterium]
MTDLWPENLGEQQFDSPVSIMREQANLLGDKTSNLVKAEVKAGSMDNGHFVYHFYIVAPTLNNYHFLLFTVEHEIELYPLEIYIDEVLGKELGAKEPFQTLEEHRKSIADLFESAAGFRVKQTKRLVFRVSSTEQFLDKLRMILASQRVQQVVSALLSQMSFDEAPIPYR